MLPPYRSFISSLRGQPSSTLQSLITNLIQEGTLRKDIKLTFENTSAYYVRKKLCNNIKILKILKI